MWRFYQVSTDRIIWFVRFYQYRPIVFYDFTCIPLRCINKAFICDYDIDCPNAFDERSCRKFCICKQLHLFIYNSNLYLFAFLSRLAWNVFTAKREAIVICFRIYNRYLGSSATCTSSTQINHHLSYTLFIILIELKCARKCVENTKFLCESFTFIPTLQSCHLSKWKFGTDDLTALVPSHLSNFYLLLPNVTSDQRFLIT